MLFFSGFRVSEEQQQRYPASAGSSLFPFFHAHAVQAKTVETQRWNRGDVLNLG